MSPESALEEQANKSRNPLCPFCGSTCTAVNEPHRLKNNGQNGAFRRRRKYECGGVDTHKFTTDEAISFGRPMMVRKKDESFDYFDFSKLLLSLQHASTPNYSAAKAEKLAQKVTRAAYKKAAPLEQGRVVDTQVIGQLALDTLKEQDERAMWIRFALIFYSLDKPAVAMPEVFGRLKREWDKA
jgi:transcriptional regulator NrdR family protein